MTVISTTTDDFGNTLHDLLVQQSQVAAPMPNQLMMPLQFWMPHAMLSLKTGLDHGIVRPK